MKAVNKTIPFQTMEVDVKWSFNLVNQGSSIIKITQKVIRSEKVILDSEGTEVLHIRIWGTDQCNIKSLEIYVTIHFDIAQ